MGEKLYALEMKPKSLYKILQSPKFVDLLKV